MNVLIVGGGIAGLVAAITLHRDGHVVTLVERATGFSPVGAGIVLAPNAARLLDSIGVDVTARGFALPALDVVNAKGKLLSRIDVSRFVDEHGPIWALARPALHDALIAALPSGVELRLGRAVTALHDVGSAVDVTFDNATERFDLVLGADGLRSRVREATYGKTELRYSGVTCYRGIVHHDRLDRAVEAWGNGSRIGIVPLGDGQVYYYLVISAARRAPALAWPEEFRAAFGAFRGDAGAVIDAIDSPPPLHHDLEELDEPVWGKGRVFLLGDAAHAMTPNQGQGAAMAIEDGVAVTQALAGGIDGALERYVARRHARVRSVQLDSRRIGDVAHWRSPLARVLRNGLMRLTPASVSAAQYRRVVEPGLALTNRSTAS
jgi:2-polyprenyl-6-methoxyphenol hydroxylase-like FAD-dependent oxidoreductase